MRRTSREQDQDRVDRVYVGAAPTWQTCSLLQGFGKEVAWSVSNARIRSRKVGGASSAISVMEMLHKTHALRRSLGVIYHARALERLLPAAPKAQYACVSVQILCDNVCLWTLKYILRLHISIAKRVG